MAEIAAAGLPAVFVPFPAAVDDHQTMNANQMQAAGSALIVNERSLSAQTFGGVLEEWLGDRTLLRERAVRSRALAKPDALDRICDRCLAVAGARP